jgi:hypothetical protein
MRTRYGTLVARGLATNPTPAVGKRHGTARTAANLLKRLDTQRTDFLRTARIDVAADEAPALHDRSNRRRAGAEERIDDQLAGLGDLAHPMADGFESLLPRMQWTLLRPAAAFGGGNVVQLSHLRGR